MTHKRAWELFFLTGLPEAYLAARSANAPAEQPCQWEKARTAFSHLPEKSEKPE